MASTATTRLRLEKQATGENSGTWGALLNAALDLLDTSVGGVSAFTVSTSKSLTPANYVADDARAFVLNITGGTGGTLTIPNVEKVYIVKNGASGTVTIGNGGTTVAVAAGASALIWTNGTNVYSVDYTLTSMTSAQLAAAVSDETGSGALVFGTAPTLSSPVVGTQSRGDGSTKAASTAYADRVAQWTTIETITTTSGSTASSTASLSAYNDLFIEIKGVSHGGGSSATLDFAIKDGASYLTARSISAESISAGQQLRGKVEITNFQRLFGGVDGLVAQSSSSGFIYGTDTSVLRPYVLATSFAGFQFSWSNGADFDANSIVVWGR